MPFTPFHLGPGALFKAAGHKHFSFLIFAGSQVLIDIEPLVRILRGDAVLHGITHNVAGAFVIGLLSALIGRPVGEMLLRQPNLGPVSIGWRVAFLSAFVGTYSHIAFDAIMHSDMDPLWPFARGNPLLDAIPLDMLHGLCVAAAIVGSAIIAWRMQRSA